jgi:hypothetical protein
MSGISVWIVMIVVGVDLGWQPRPQKGTEYVIQVDPGTLESLKQSGEAAQSEIPAEAQDIHASRIRIVVGKQPLPRELPAKMAEKPPAPAAEKSPPPPPLDPASKPLTANRTAVVEPTAEGATPQAKPPADKPAASAESQKPGLFFWAMVLGLSGSVTANVYLGWLFVDARRRIGAGLVGKG